MNSKDGNLMPPHINHWLAANVEICYTKMEVEWQFSKLLFRKPKYPVSLHMVTKIYNINKQTDIYKYSFPWKNTSCY